MKYQRHGKRFLDLIILALSSPIWLTLAGVVACSVWLILSRPLLFVERRVGVDGKVFKLIKFRTMIDDREENGDLLPYERRVTRLGRFLRSTSLDEIPELFNVLRGEMSLVGPRPLPVRYLPRYSPEQRRRHEVLPGVTGIAQTSGRNTTTWKERLQLDVWYVDSSSFCLDLKILGITVWKVLKMDGNPQSFHATMEEFQGDRDTSIGE